MPKRTATVIACAVVLLTLVVVPAMAMSDTGKTTQQAATTKTRALAAEQARLKTIKRLRKKTLMYVRATRHRQQMMGVAQTTVPRRTLASVNLRRLRQGFNQARQHSLRVIKKYRRPPLLSDWLCIHHYEGAWNDPGGPYWGGLQMDINFQRHYGDWLLRHKGTANRWTPMEQIWVAVRAWRSRGFDPWPNTAHYCGLR